MSDEVANSIQKSSLPNHGESKLPKMKVVSSAVNGLLFNMHWAFLSIGISLFKKDLAPLSSKPSE
jgi:hypothetical protein